MTNFEKILQMTDDFSDRELNILIGELSIRFLERVRRSEELTDQPLCEVMIDSAENRQLEALREIRNTILNK